MNDETLAKIQFDAELDARVDELIRQGYVMCESCGLWDGGGYGPVIEIIPTEAGIEPTCRDCALYTQVPGNSPDAIVECTYCGEWSFESDGWYPSESDQSLWVCHFCSVNRGDEILEWVDNSK